MAEKYALITGASSGIGYAVALKLCKLGYKVFGCAPAKFVPDMDPLRDEYGLVAFACDISNVEDVKKAVQLVTKATGGRLDILYNNAGIAFGGPAGEVVDAELERIFQVNVFGHIYMTKYFLDLVIAAKGTIVFTCSVAARVPLSWTSTYCATKGAIESYAWNLHAEMKPFGVRVHSVITGGVNTGIGDGPKGDLSDRLRTSRYNVDGLAESVLSTSNMSRNSKFSAHQYADELVSEIHKKSSKFNLYHGYSAYSLHLLGRYAPVWLTEYFLSVYFKQKKVLDNVAKKVAGGQSARGPD